eukprot:GEMP01000616.1.p1 GENE.GEMP01000616.1~~GEMP01000616.1.p1  ORF type:complete len:1858 (+),score=416.66 GEMP01000616.1:112-5685(+)
MLSRCASDYYHKLRQDVDTYDGVINAELGHEYVELGLFATVINEEILAIESNRYQVISEELRQQVRVLQQANDNFAQRSTCKLRAPSRSPSPKRWRHLYGRKPRTPFGQNIKMDRLLVRRFMKRHLSRLRIVILDHEAKYHEDERMLMQEEKREIAEAQYRTVAVVEGAKEKIRSERESCEMDLQRKYSQKAVDQMNILEAEVNRHRDLLSTAKLELGNRFMRWSRKCQLHMHIRNSFDSWRRYAITRLNGQLRNTLGKLRIRLDFRSEVIQHYAVETRAECLVRSCFAALVHNCHRLLRDRASDRCSTLVSDNRLLADQLEALHRDLHRIGWSRRKSLSNYDALQTLQCQRHAFIVWRVALERAKTGRTVKLRSQEVLVSMRAMVDLAATVYPARAFLAWKHFIDKIKDTHATAAVHLRLHSTEQRITDQLILTEEQWKEELRVTKEHLTDQLQRVTVQLQHSEATKRRMRESHLRVSLRWLTSVQRLALHSALKAWSALAFTSSLRTSHSVKLDMVSARMHATLGTQVFCVLASLKAVAFKSWRLAYQQRCKCTRAFRRKLQTRLLLEVLRGLHVAAKMAALDRMRQQKRDSDVAARLHMVSWIGMSALLRQWFALASRRRIVRLATVNLMSRTHVQSDRRRLITAFKQWVVHKVASRLEFMNLRARLAKNNCACLIASNAQREIHQTMFIAFFAWNHELHLVKHERHSVAVTRIETQLMDSRRSIAYTRHMVVAQIAFRGAADINGILNAWRWAVADARRETQLEAKFRSLLEEKTASKRTAGKKAILRMIQQNDDHDAFLLQSILMTWRQCQQSTKHKNKLMQTRGGWTALQASMLGSTEMRIILLEWKNTAETSKRDRAFDRKFRESVASLSGEMRARQWARLTELLMGLVKHKAVKKVFALSYRKITERFSTQCEQKDQALAVFLSSADSENARVFCLSRAFRLWNQKIVQAWRERSTDSIRRAQEKSDQFDERAKASSQKRTMALVFGDTVATAVHARACFLAWGSLVASGKIQKALEERYKKELTDTSLESAQTIKLLQSQMQQYLGSYLSKSSTEADWTLIQHLFLIWKAEREENQYKKQSQENMETLEEHYKHQELDLREQMQELRQSIFINSKKLMSQWFTRDDQSSIRKFFSVWKNWLHNLHVATRWAAAHKVAAELSLMTLVFRAWMQMFQTEINVKELEAHVTRVNAEKLRVNAAAEDELQRVRGQAGITYAKAMMKIFLVKAFQAWADVTRKGTDRTRMFGIMQHLAVETSMGLTEKYFLEWKNVATSPKLLLERMAKKHKFLLTLDSRFSSIWIFADFLIISLGFEMWKSFATINKTNFMSESRSFVQFLEQTGKQQRQDKMALFLQQNARRRDLDRVKETLHAWRWITSKLALKRTEQSLCRLEELAYSPKSHSYCQTSKSAYSPPESQARHVPREDLSADWQRPYPHSMPMLLSLEAIPDKVNEQVGSTPDIAPHNHLFRDRARHTYPPSGSASCSPRPRSPHSQYRPYPSPPASSFSPRPRSLRSHTVPAHPSPRAPPSPHSRAASFSPPLPAAASGVVPPLRYTSALAAPPSTSGSALARPRSTSSGKGSNVIHSAAQYSAGATVPCATPATCSTAPPLAQVPAPPSVADRLRLFGPRAGVSHLDHVPSLHIDSTEPPPLVDPLLPRTAPPAAPVLPPPLGVSTAGTSYAEPFGRGTLSNHTSIHHVHHARAADRISNGGHYRDMSGAREPERTDGGRRVRSHSWDDFREREGVERRREAAEDEMELESQASDKRIRQLEAQVRILQGQCNSIEEDVHSTVREVRSHVQRSAHRGATGGPLSDWGTQSWILHKVNRLESTLSPMRRARQKLEVMNKV